MNVDPAHHCPDHGAAELTFYETQGRRYREVKAYCRACRRARAKRLGIVKVNRSKSHCYRGHLKTLRTWRAYRGVHRCLTCQYIRDRERKEGRYVRPRAAA